MGAANGTTQRASTAMLLLIAACMILSIVQLIIVTTNSTWWKIKPHPRCPAAPPASADACQTSTAASTGSAIPGTSAGECGRPTPAAPANLVSACVGASYLDETNAAIIGAASDADVDGAGGAWAGARGPVAAAGDGRLRRRLGRCPRCTIIRCDARTCFGGCRARGQRFNCSRRRDMLARGRSRSEKEDIVLEPEVVQVGSILFDSTVDYCSAAKCRDPSCDGDAEYDGDYYGVYDDARECDGEHAGDCAASSEVLRESS